MKRPTEQELVRDSELHWQSFRRLSASILAEVRAEVLTMRASILNEVRQEVREAVIKEVALAMARQRKKAARKKKPASRKATKRKRPRK